MPYRSSPGGCFKVVRTDATGVVDALLSETRVAGATNRPLGQSGDCPKIGGGTGEIMDLMARVDEATNTVHDGVI